MQARRAMERTGRENWGGYIDRMNRRPLLLWIATLLLIGIGAALTLHGLMSPPGPAGATSNRSALILGAVFVGISALLLLFPARRSTRDGSAELGVAGNDGGGDGGGGDD